MENAPRTSEESIIRHALQESKRLSHFNKSLFLNGTIVGTLSRDYRIRYNVFAMFSVLHTDPSSIFVMLVISFCIFNVKPVCKLIYANQFYVKFWVT